MMLCMCMIVSMMWNFGGTVLSSVAQPTDSEYITDRISDPNTMDDYLMQLLSMEWGSRYAGRIWTDKSVFAYGQSGVNWDGKQLLLDMATDGYDGNVSSSADFLHVFSTLGSSQELAGVPPVRTVIVFDNSASMYNSSNVAASSGEKLWQQQRIAITIEAINRAIDILMEASVYNEVAVVLFGDGPNNGVNAANSTYPYIGNNTAVTILPMKHYTPSKTAGTGEDMYTPYLTGGWDSGDRTIYFNGSKPRHEGTGTDGKSGSIGGGWVFVNNDLCGLNKGDGDGEDWNDTGFNDCNDYAYTGYKNGTTNIQAGYYVGMQELLNADKTVRVGSETYQCVPSLVMLTDGAATDKLSGDFITPDINEKNGYPTNMDFVNDTTNKLRSFVGYDCVGKDNGKDYKPKDMPNFWDMFVEMIEEGTDKGKYKSVVGSDQYTPITDDATAKPTGAGLDAMKEVADTYSDSVASMLLGTLMTNAYYKAAVRRAYGIADDESWDIFSLSVDMVDMGEVPHDAAIDAMEPADEAKKLKSELPSKWEYNITSNAPTMNPSEFFYKDGKVDLEWLKDRGYVDKNVDMAEAIKDPSLILENTAYPDYSVGEMVIQGIVKAGHYLNMWADKNKTDSFTTKYQGWQENTGIFGKSNWASAATNPYSHSNGYLLEEKKSVLWPQIDPDNAENVTKQDVLDNIGYNSYSYYASTSGGAADELAGKFQLIIDAITEPLFIPISGENAAGVGDSITYQDPLGEYMEIKNQAIETMTHKDEDEGSEKPGTYDMSLLVFGKMHGLVRAGVYDWQWNDKYMQKHGLNVGTAAFPMGWYYGDDPETAVGASDKDGVGVKSDDSGSYPAHSLDGKTEYSNAEDAWADGWVYRFNFSTVLQFVPITGVNASEVHPSDLPDQVKNTVYTCYRFAGSQKERNALHRNPAFGDVPDQLKNTWKTYEDKGSYPADDSVYASTPGVYRLSDIRVWVEDTGDFADTTGAITPNQGYDRSLYLNIPAAAVPTQLATVTLGQEGVLSYITNLAGDKKYESAKGSEKIDYGSLSEDDKKLYADYSAQSTPFRLFYAVGLEDDLILWEETKDSDGNTVRKQIGVDFTKISPEYITAHTTEKENYVWFISNYFSNTTYDDYVQDSAGTSRGDPTITFSPNIKNRYYIFQKPLPLYAHAYRNTDGGLKPVDNINDLWREWASGTVGKGDWNWKEAYPNGAGNGKTAWEGGARGGSWSGGEYIGTYKDGSTFTKAKDNIKLEADGKRYITDDHENTYLYVDDGIIFLEADALDHVTSEPGSDNYTSDSVSFNSEDYFFILIEYYVPDPDSEVKDGDGNVIFGAHTGRMVQRVVARRGSEFGSGFVSDKIYNGDMLCWVSMNNDIDEQFDYLSKTDSGDLTRGEPTWQKLTFERAALETYLTGTCKIGADSTMPNPEYDSSKPEGPDNPKEVNVLQHQLEYWTKLQGSEQIRAALSAADENEDGCDEDEFKKAFSFVVATKPGGIRSGNMANNVHAKDDNVTRTARNYYVPVVSAASGIGNQAILNNYMGNNGYLEISNEMLHVTKMIEAPGGYKLTKDQKNEIFNYQIYIQGVSGTRNAVMTQYNEFSKTWDRQLAYIDVLTDNSDLVLDNNSNRALFVETQIDGSGGTKVTTAKQVIANGTDDDGETMYYEANEDGTLPLGDDGNVDEGKRVTITPENPLYYLYLPSNGNDASSQHTRRLYQNTDYDGAEDGYPKGTNFVKNGTTTFYSPGQRPEGDTGTAPDMGNNDSYRESTDPKRPAGTITYWAQDAELIPITEVQEAEAIDEIVTDGSAAYEIQAENSTPGMWTHEVSEGGAECTKEGHVSLTFFTLVIRRPSGETSMTAFESPFKTRSKYMTLELKFGIDQTEVYDRTVPSADADPSNPFDGITLAGIAKNTAEFTLTYGEGLLLSGLDNDITYRFTEKLTDGQLAKGYTLKQIDHIEEAETHKTKQKNGVDNGVYSVYGNTGSFEEQINYINTWDPDALVVSKSLEAAENTSINDYDKNVGFNYTVTFTLPDWLKGESLPASGLPYWKGKTADLNKAVSEENVLKGGAPRPTDYDAINKLPDKLTATDGSYSFTLKADESIVIYSLPLGTTYTVTEAEDPDYPVKSGTGTGSELSGTIAKSSPDAENHVVNLAPYTNVKSARSLTIEKKIMGDSPDTSKDFTFEITLAPPDGKEITKESLTVSPDGKTVDWSADSETNALKATFTLKHGEKITIDGIPTGTNYVVKETGRSGYNLEHVTTDPYDKDEKQIQKLNPDGSISGTVSKESAQVYWLFVNAKAPTLPFTGNANKDTGMWIIMGAGILLMIASSAVVFALKKRRGAHVK